MDAPFRLSLRGIAVEVGGPQSFSKGNLIKVFKLVDKEGSWVQFIVVCAQALKTLRENADVILFIATGRGCLKSLPGTIFVFESACLWNVQKPRMTRQVKSQ